LKGEINLTKKLEKKLMPPAGNHQLRRFLQVFGLLFALLLCPVNAICSPHTVTDMAGRRVVLKRAVKRIVTTFKPATLSVFALGLQKRIVGIDSSAKRDRLLQALLPEVGELTGVGSKSTGINFETVVSLAPDLVILYAQKDGIELAGRLTLMQIPSIIILPESFASINTSLEIIAAAAGAAEHLAEIRENMEAVLALVDKRVRKLSPGKRKTGCFVSPRGLFSTATGNMLQDEIFTRAGIINVAHDLNGYFQDISPEQFILWNPDMVIFSQHLHQQVARRLNDPALQQVTAVKNRAVYRFPCDLAPWDFPSPLAVLGTLWLAQKSYPQLFADIDINHIIDDFHQRLFGKTLTSMHGNLNDRIY
jgi:iron complex transport system substrate-binding protein